ncbi:hypothetical protein SAMN04489860_1746 [Paraoerskovia marina]|uniref:Uncharacterized protein n=1 Tax=Paraoerskovia marina TaxID=545619 RepID=A0A1H1SX99_9CELL|nr:hypothetical protein [Paraoerskovia marina]SDS52602.1 hypothetical protein SAMN04489860_1746 [Paraoerskovia marina]
MTAAHDRRGVTAPLVVATALGLAAWAFGDLADAITTAALVLTVVAVARIAPHGTRATPTDPTSPRPGGARPDLDLLGRETLRTDRTVGERAVARTLDLTRATLIHHGIDPTSPADRPARAALLGNTAPANEKALAGSSTAPVTAAELRRWLDVLDTLGPVPTVAPADTPTTERPTR